MIDLELEDRRIRVDVGVYAKDAIGLTIDQIVLDACHPHRTAPP